MSVKRFIEHFTGLWLSTRSIGHGLFDADDVMALRALAEAMTGAIHFVPWSKPAHVGQFWLFHTASFPQARRFGYLWLFKTDPLSETRRELFGHAVCIERKLSVLLRDRWMADAIQQEILIPLVNHSCVIVGVQATAARMSQETVAAQDMLTRFTQWQGREPESVAADTTYGNGEFLQWLADRSITPYMRTRDSIHRKNSPPRHTKAG